MGLASAIAALTLFAFACGLAVGVGVTQAWHEHRDDDLALVEQAIWDDEQSVQ
jgi:hypothetical protein